MYYVEKLVSYGFSRCCAENIVRDYIDNGKEKDLADYISAKNDVEGRL